MSLRRGYWKKSREIRKYYDRGWYPESLYLLAMLDYISRVNDVPLCSEYDDLRQCRLEKPLYPASVLAICAASKNDSAMIQAAVVVKATFLSR